jgi:KAP family P-loop domain
LGQPRSIERDKTITLNERKADEVDGHPASHEEASSYAPETTVLRAYTGEAFEPWPSWRRLRRALNSTGGAYGLAGPRGAGKTWLMQAAVDKARAEGGMGLWYPSPSEYDPAAFLASLSDTFANEVEARRARAGRGEFARQTALHWISRAEVAAIGTILLAIVGLASALGAPQWLNVATAVLLFAFFAFLILDYLYRLRQAGRDEGRLRLYARKIRERVRFSLSRREALEFGAEGGKGLLGRLRASRERELMERPLTLSSLIQDFRELVRLAGVAADPSPVVIAIDELDKMDDHERVRQLLRDIKGIFGVNNVFFLVSVSHEAARALNLNGLGERNEFNSSFETVFELTLPTPTECEQLLRHRNAFQRGRAGRALGVLSGGLPRELVRLAEVVMADTDYADATTTARAVAVALRTEALEFRREVLRTTGYEEEPIGDEIKIAIFNCLAESRFRNDAFEAFARDLVHNHWEPPWKTDAWERRFGEEWRRLLARLAVAATMVANESQLDDPHLACDLQAIVALSSESGAVAMWRMTQLEERHHAAASG